MANAPPNSSTILPPISMFTSSRSSSNQRQTFMPESPPSSGYDKQLKFPKPHQGEYFNKERLLSPPPASSNYHQKQSSAHSSSASSPYTPATTTPDQHTLWVLFNQFQQQQQQQKNPDAYRYTTNETDSNRRASDPVSLTTSDRVLSSEEVLAEKRRRNAGASARFRDRRKQRERELQDRCNELEQRLKAFENALRRAEPEHPLLSLSKQPTPPPSEYDHRQSPPPNGYASEQNTLFDRVGQLEHLMTRFRQEKETDVQKLDQLEKENEYLRSLLVPVSLPSVSTRDSATDSDSSVTSHTNSVANKRKQNFSQDQPHKRIHLPPPPSHHSLN